MSSIFPSRGITKKFVHAASADNTALTSTITVPSTQYGVIYRLWVDVDVATEADLENLVAGASITVTIGAKGFDVAVHPYIQHREATEAYIRTVDLGPWFFDFGPDGLYSGVKGDNIVVGVVAMGTGIKSRANYLYSGD